MRVLNLHSWDISTTEAGILQRDLATRVVRSRCSSFRPLHIAGVDVSVDRLHGTARAAVVVLSYPGMQPVETRTVEGCLSWPYVPGFLSFREAPLILSACSELDIVPDLLLVDGQGIAHPRGFGLASHLGLFLDIPAVGCAKSLLCGTHACLDTHRGATAELTYKGEIVGAAVRTRTGVKPVYVSIGHKTDLATAVEWVLHCSGRYRLPEPTRLAHIAASGSVR
ncbi:MAG: deoxyribonuclease V [Dehalococcoidia bacterium]|nr:deoxyribonuclease V [Dehalococcoidia bacterium]